MFQEFRGKCISVEDLFYFLLSPPYTLNYMSTLELLLGGVFGSVADLLTANSAVTIILGLFNCCVIHPDGTSYVSAEFTLTFCLGSLLIPPRDIDKKKSLFIVVATWVVKEEEEKD